MRVTRSSSRSDIESTMGARVDRESIRTSDARANRLQRNIRRQARQWDAEVEVPVDLQTAHVEHTPNEPPTVRVTGREVDQPVTDLDPRSWDWLVQRAMGLHEVGHIRYTDFEDFDRKLDNMFDGGEKGTAHNLYNAAEDAAIEQQVARRWSNSYSLLRTLRANLFGGSHNAGIPDPEQGGYIFPVAHAAQAACLDLLAREVYDLNIGTLDALVDMDDESAHFVTDDDYALFCSEILPKCRDLIEAATTTPDPKQRNMDTLTEIRVIMDLLEQADESGNQQQEESGQNGDSDGAGMPDDSRENHSGGATVPASELGEDDADSADGGQDSDQTGDDTAPAGEASQPAGGDGEDPALVDAEDLDDVTVNPDLEEKADEAVQVDAREVAGVTDELLDEMDEMVDALGASDDELDDEFILPEQQQEPDRQVWERARDRARPLEQLLRQRLQQERRSKRLRHQRRGRIDGSALHRTAVDSREIMQRETEPDEKDYSCVLMVDGSGSMRGRRSKDATISVAMLVQALESVGVDTMVVKLYSGTAVLKKPFGSSPEQYAGHLSDTAADGGTPLTQCLRMCRNRLNRQTGKKFLISLTDGRPSNATEYEAVLQQCHFPVLGITIGDGEAGQQYYDRAVETAAGEDMQRTLQNLLTEVMF